MKITSEALKNPPKKYRPLPFWSWNSELKVPETLFQVEEMDKVGMGGYFMHARGGLKTEYMGKEWMDNVRACITEGEKRGMASWGYDENGWPSGFGSGAVNNLGSRYQQKYIYMDITDEPVQQDFTITNLPGENGKNMHFYYGVNRFYVDTMDGFVTEEFLHSTHEKYKSELGEDFSKLAGFFTDEPQMSRAPKSIPWSVILPDEYLREYGEDLLPLLPHLFITTEEAYKTRFRYWRLVTKLFSENFTKKVYDWCETNGTKLTGHMVCEETFSFQLDPNGSCMPNYMYMHIPGVDKLCRGVERLLLLPQLTSVCAQTGKKQILTESFALCGWDVSFEELKWILEWQMVQGANLLCQHLAGYSLGGLRKRDYPAGHFFQNPWWNDYKMFNDFASRVGMIIAEGEIKCDVLILHTISSAWLDRCDDFDWHSYVDEKYTNKLMEVIIELDKNQILNHLGDETVMEKLGSVEGNKLRIGEMSYSTVIIPKCKNISSNTLRLLKEFSANGGNLIFAEEIPAYVDGVKSADPAELAGTIYSKVSELCSLIPDDAKYITLTRKDGSVCDIQFNMRKHDDFTSYYMVNTYSGDEIAVFTAEGKSLAQFDYMTGEIVPYPFTYSDGKVTAELDIRKMGSVMLFVYDDNRYTPYTEEAKVTTNISSKLGGKWKIADAELNALTLDYCDVYFDGKLAHTNIPVTDIQEIANSFERKVNVRMDYRIKSDITLGNDTYLIVEEADHYDITINGKPIEKKICGYYRDKSFMKLDISGCIVQGENLITLVTDFEQPQHIYETVKDCYDFEAMRNKLWYDREIECIYLLGRFGVNSETEFTPGENRSVITNGGFVVTDMPGEVECGDITTQGFPFFTGSMTFEKEVTFTKDELNGKTLEFDRMGAVITKVRINGTELDPIVWAPYSISLDGLLCEGTNTIQIELISNFRNLLGPLHLGTEAYDVTPSSFQHNSKIFGNGLNKKWHDSYAFLEYGIFPAK